MNQKWAEWILNTFLYALRSCTKMYTIPQKGTQIYQKVNKLLARFPRSYLYETFVGTFWK